MPYEDKYQDGDIIEPEQWRNPEEQQFNHQALVMSAMKKVLDSGSDELREGWWDEKVDKLGNVRRTWNKDTRKIFIESVRSLLMVMECDFDDEAKKVITDLISQIEIRRTFWMNEEWKWWSSLNPIQRQQLTKEGKHVVQGYFNKKLDFDNYFFEEEVGLYRQICTELNKLTYRLDFYGQIGYTA